VNIINDLILKDLHWNLKGIHKITIKFAKQIY